MTEETEQPNDQPPTAENRPTLGAKMFVIFFMLIVPPLGIALLAAMCWSLWKMVMSGA